MFYFLETLTQLPRMQFCTQLTGIVIAKFIHGAFGLGHGPSCSLATKLFPNGSCCYLKSYCPHTVALYILQCSCPIAACLHVCASSQII